MATRLKRGVFRGYMRDYEFRLLRGHGRGPMRINGAFHLQGEQVVVKVTLRMSWFMYVAYLPYLACFFGVTLFALLRKGVNAIPFGPIVPVGLLGWICLISIGFRASALKVERILLRTFGIRAPDDEEEEDS